MPLSGTPAPPNKRKKISKIITDLSHITQDEYESEPEASEFDLGKKIRVPRDIMLEELTLMKNKGSKMFRMRQLRVEKFIHENNPDLFTTESMGHFQKFVPTLGGQMIDIGGHLIGRQMAEQAGWAGQGPVPPPKPGSYGRGAGVLSRGAGVGTIDGVTSETSRSEERSRAAFEKSKKRSNYVKTYISPWERAMKGNEDLLSTMKLKMPTPSIYQELQRYKSFNRSAMPYGGFDKAAQLMTFQLPDIEVATVEPEPSVVYQHDIGARPSFNRTPIGWGGSVEPGSIHMELETIPFDGETDDL